MCLLGLRTVSLIQSSYRLISAIKKLAPRTPSAPSKIAFRPHLLPWELKAPFLNFQTNSNYRIY